MDILLISGRSVDGLAHPTRAQARALAGDLAVAGHQVRWLCPVHEGEALAVIEGVETVAIVSGRRSFRAVEGRLVDVELERRLCASIRARAPDVVHVLSFGGADSAISSWLAQRLGVPALVHAELAVTVCHRGTLVHVSGAPCDDWRDPRRCLECCLTPSPHGLSRGQARAARLLRVLGGFSPFPKEVEFENRLELVIGGLQAAACVLVPSADQIEPLVATGVPRANLRVEPTGGDVAAISELYREFCGELGGPPR